VTSMFVYNLSGGGCPAPLVLTIRRQQTTTVGGVNVVFSWITLQYPYQYHVAGILKVVAPTSTFPTSATLSGGVKHEEFDLGLWLGRVCCE